MQHKLMKTTGCRKCDHRACQKQLLVDEFGHAHSVSQKMPLVWMVSIRGVEFAQSDFRRQHPASPFPSTTPENLPRTFLRETPPAGHTASKRGTLNVSHTPRGAAATTQNTSPQEAPRKLPDTEVTAALWHRRCQIVHFHHIESLRGAGPVESMQLRSPACWVFVRLSEQSSNELSTF